MLRNAVYLAFRSLWWYRGRSSLIILCLAVTLWVPVTVRLLIDQFQQEILNRAAVTPLIIGASGSRIDLVLHGLYFQSAAPPSITMEESDYVANSDFAAAIPLHVRFRTQTVDRIDGAPLVGTTLEYFEFRNLKVAAGESLSRLGDCVLGAGFAERTGLRPGASLMSAPRNAFNLAGDYPLKMRVAGILGRSHSPDDEAVFIDIKTAWVIEGIGHGHQTLTKNDRAQLLSAGDSSKVTANASVLPYTEITAENETSFHFHGDEADFPISEVIAVPHDRQSQTLLLGRYASVRQSSAICVKPQSVVQDLLAMVFRVEELFRVVAIVSGLVTALLFGLVIFLGIRLRAAEMSTMQRLGSARGTTGLLVGTETTLMLISAIVMATGSALVTSHFGSQWLRQWLF